MMKKLLALICILFSGLGLNSQSVITIGTGAAGATGVNYNPIYRSSAASSFDYSRAFYLYTAAELAAAGLPPGATITQIEWNKSNTGATVASTANVVFNIFMNNSSMASYATAATWATLNTGATLVYNNNNQVIPATTGFLPFTLTTPFVYNGNSLEISTDWDISAVSGNPTTAGFTFLYTPAANSVGGNSNSAPLTGATSMATQANRPNIRITYLPPPACTGAPNSGTANISSSTGCANVPFNLSATGLSAASALTYQWFSAPSASGPWSSIPNATTSAISTSASAITFYQMVTTCTVSALSATTTITSFTPTSCNFMSTTTLNICSGLLYDSGGPTANYQNSEDYTLTIIPSTANAMAQLIFNNFSVETCCDYLQIYDGPNTSYPLIGQYTSLPPSITATNVTGALTLRFFSDGSVVFPGFEAVVSCSVPPFCAGAPNSGTAAISTPSGCPNNNFNLITNGITTGSGISYLWYSAPSASGPWTSIPTATNAALTTNVANTTYFKMTTTCSVSAITATSSVISYSVVNPGPCICNGYGVSAATSNFDEEIWNVTFGTLNNTSNCTAIAPGLGSILNMYGNYTGFVSAPTVLQGQTVPFSVDINTCNGWYGVAFDIYIDYNQNGLFTDAGELAYTNSTAIQGVNPGTITIPLTATPGITRMRVVAVEGTVPGPTGTYSWGETEDYCIDIQVPSLCSGAPLSGTASINTPSGCPNVNLSMNATGVTNASGIVYQWQSAPSATGPWTNIAAANATTYTTTVSSTTYFQMVTTCTVSALSATTSVVSYSVVNPGPCICNGYGASAATSPGDEEIWNVTFGSLNNTSNCTVIAPGPGSILNMYGNYTGFVSAPTVLQGQTVPFSVDINTCGGWYGVAFDIYIDYNQNGLFTDAGELAYTNSTAIQGINPGTINIPLTATPGITRMRVVAVEGTVPGPTGNYTWGETEDYCIDIQVPSLCSGAPLSGTTSINTPSGCPNVNLSMNATGVTNASGIIYQWQSAPSATGPWTNIAAANATTYTTTVSSTTYFQMVTTCTVSALSATTSIVSYSVVNPGPCVCGGYASSAATSIADEEILNVTFGSLNSTSSCTTTAPGPGSSQNLYSNYSGFIAAPVVLQGQSVPFSLQIGTCGGNFNNAVSVYIDYNQNGVFTDAGEQAYLSAASTNGPHFETGNILIPLTASVGVTRMRVVNVETTSPASINSTGGYTWGETEDYCIDIQTPLPCSGAPLSGTAAISSPTGCLSDPLYLSANGVTNALGITYQWQSAPSASGPWSNIATATAVNYSTTAASVTFYRMITTCSVSALSATTSIVSYTPLNCYLMSNATITACGGTLYDSGGPQNNYQSNEDYTLTIMPSTAASSVILTFATFSVETCCDYLEIYDGTSTSAPLIGSYTSLPPSITAANSSGALTLRFFSDGSVVYFGFSAAISCTSSCAGPPSAPTATAATICSGNQAILTASVTGTAKWYSTATSTAYIAVGSSYTTPILMTNTTYYVKDSTACGLSSVTAVNVTVIPTPTLNISSSSPSVCIGSSATLTASGMDTYTWSTTSTNTSIVVSPSVNTTYTLSGFSNACNITQTASILLGTNPNPTVTLSAGGVSTICVTNGSIALVGSPNGGVYSGVGVVGNLQSIAVAGTFTPVYSFTNSATGCFSSATTTIIVSNCTGINGEAFSINSVRVYPNPNTGSFNIETNTVGLKTIELMDLSGRIILTETSSDLIIQINIDHLANGLYQVKVKSDKGTNMIKVIKQ